MNPSSRIAAGLAGLLLVGAVGAAEAPGGFQPGKTYLTTCTPADAKGNFSCEHKVVETPVATPEVKVAGAPVSAPASAPVAASAASAPKPVSPLDAQGKAVVAKTADEAITNLLQADYSIPASPAAALLGISADKVQRPATIRELSAAVVRGIGRDGKVQSAVALDVAPAFVLFPRLIGAGDDYAPAGATSDADGHLKQRLLRMLARTTLSFGTTNPDASGASRSALGLRVGLYDSGDPGLYWTRAVDCVSQIEGVIPGGPPPNPGEVAAPIPVDYSKCDPMKDLANNLWAKPSLYAGYGRSWYSKTGALTDHAPDVRQIWISGSAGWAPDDKAPGRASDWRALAQLYFGRRLNDRAADPKNAGQLLREDASETVLRLRAGKTAWHGFVEYGRSRVSLGDATTRNLRHNAYGAEFMLDFLGGKDNWLEIASVRKEGVLDGKTYSGVLMNFRIGTPSLTITEAGATASKK
jgi:hypothetical protein